MCDRVATINKKNIVAIDAPESLKKTIQNVRSIKIAFDRNSIGILDELSQLPLVNKVLKEGDKFKVFTEFPSEVVDALVAYAHSKSLKILSISTLGLSLEDVFVRLPGLKRAGENSCHLLSIKDGQNAYLGRCTAHGPSPKRI